MKGLLALLFLSAVLAERRRYDGYHVLEVYPRTDEQLTFLNSQADEETDSELMFWDTPVLMNRRAEILVPPYMVRSFVAQLEGIGAKINVLTENVQEGLDDTWNRVTNRRAYDSDDFNTLEDIMDHLYALLDDCPPNLECSIRNIGESVEGRDLLVFEISPHHPTEASIWVDSTIHAREHVATTSVMKALEELLWEYDVNDQDKDETYLLETYDWHFEPMVNPDGYLYSWTNDRMWRKNRRNNEGALCMGVDVNRNYKYDWGTGGSSSNACTSTYMGPYPHSEPECYHQVNETARMLDDHPILMWVSVHTAAEMWLHAYGSTYPDSSDCKFTVDNDDQYEAARVMATVAENSYPGEGEDWVYGSICTTIYEASGTTVDQMYDMGIKYAYTPELRGPGFDPGQEHIEPGFREFYNSLVAGIYRIEQLEGMRSE